MKSILLGVLMMTAAQVIPSSVAHAAEGSAVREQGTPAARKEVIQAIDAWRSAVIKKDRAGLERAYHDDLSYGHTDGAVLTKREQIDRTLVPDRDFTAVDATDVAVRTYGNVAYVTASYAFHVKQQGEEARVAKLAGLDVWTKGTNGWQLIARQLTRLAQ
jgi:ketosteroid isomerase-like protein